MQTVTASDEAGAVSLAVLEGYCNTIFILFDSNNLVSPVGHNSSLLGILDKLAMESGPLYTKHTETISVL